MPRVVILSGHSLFVEGISTRLRQVLASDEIETIDARHDDAIARVAAAQPAIVILEASDVDVENSCSLSALLNVLSSLTVIRLDRDQDFIQVVTTKKQAVGQVGDLIDMIRAIE